MSFLVNDNGLATAANLPANSITAAMLAANAATTAKFADKSATLNKFASDAKAALMGPAAAALATFLAETAANRAGFIGDFYLADDFEADTLATKTNSTYDAASDYYGNPAGFTANINPVLSGYSGGGLTVSANKERPGAYYAWQAFNDNYANNWDTYQGGGNMYEGILTLTYDTPKTIGRISLGKQAANGTPYLPGDFTFEGWNGTAWDVLLTVSGLAYLTDYPNGNVQYPFDLTSVGIYSIYRLNVTATSGSGTNEIKIGKMECYEVVAPAAQTLAPTPATLETANPTDLIAFVLIDPQEAITVGTDIAMSMSVDGGTTDAVGTWTSLGYIGGTNLELYSVEADVSAQSGSNLTYEILTANNKEIRLHQLVGIKAFY